MSDLFDIKGKRALVTGGSRGIGLMIARGLVAAGADVIVSSRKSADVQAAADELAQIGGCEAMTGDVSSPEGAAALAAAVRKRFTALDVIVNNAGAGLIGAADTLDRAEQLALIDLNVRALTDLSLAFIDSLKRRRGGILNVASLAAFMPGPGRAVYYASKAYVLSFSEALHRELKPHGVRVTVLCPGPVPTALQARAGMSGLLPRLLMRSAEAVAREAYRGLKAGRRMVVPGFANRVVTMAIRLAPRGLWLELIARRGAGGTHAA
jgi:short-subunit dehydrogenase